MVELQLGFFQLLVTVSMNAALLQLVTRQETVAAAHLVVVCVRDSSTQFIYISDLNEIFVASCPATVMQVSANTCTQLVINVSTFIC